MCDCKVDETLLRIKATLGTSWDQGEATSPTQTLRLAQVLPASGSSSACVGAVQPNHRGNMAALFSSCSQVVGLAIFAAGIYLAVTGERYAVLTGSSIVAGAAILIVCGIITIAISVVGLVAAIGQFRWILLIVSSTRLINLSTLTLFTTPTPCHHTLAHIVTTPTCYQHTLTRFTITPQSHTRPNPNTHYTTPSQAT